MSKQEANVLIAWGKLWFGHMWVGADSAERDRLIAHVNAELNAVGLKLGRGWQNYDPVIRRTNGAPSSYAEIAASASRQPDKGQGAAQTFLNWARDDITGLVSLPGYLQELAVITHLAEVGRGYESALEGQLYRLLEAIAAGINTWGNYREYSPSLTYKEDRLMDWSPAS